MNDFQKDLFDAAIKPYLEKPLWMGGPESNGNNGILLILHNS